MILVTLDMENVGEENARGLRISCCGTECGDEGETSCALVLLL